MPTKDECKKILSNLGFEFGVSPRLIATRLLSDQDKSDMTMGLVPISSLSKAIEVWKHYGMPNYVDCEIGSCEIQKFERNEK